MLSHVVIRMGQIGCFQTCFPTECRSAVLVQAAIATLALVCCNQAFRFCMLQTLQTLDIFSSYSLGGSGQLWPVFEAHRGGTSWARAATWIYPWSLSPSFWIFFSDSERWTEDRFDLQITSSTQAPYVQTLARFALNELSTSWGWLTLECRTQTIEFMQPKWCSSTSPNALAQGK